MALVKMVQLINRLRESGSSLERERVMVLSMGCTLLYLEIALRHLWSEFVSSLVAPSVDSIVLVLVLHLMVIQDALKHVVKAGDGNILTTSSSYTCFMKSGVDFALVSPGMPRVDMWIREFLKHEIPCVVADYLEFVCNPDYSLGRHVLYNTHSWAEKLLANMVSNAEEIVTDLTPPNHHDPSDTDDITCQVCGCSDSEEVMLICGTETGSVGCGGGTHIDYCDPPLENVPEYWFCSKCTTSRINPPNKRKNWNSPRTRRSK